MTSIHTRRTLKSTPEAQALAHQIRAEVLRDTTPDIARTLASEEPLRRFRRDLVAELYDQLTTLPGAPSFATAALRPARVPTTVPTSSPWLPPLQALGLLACLAAGYALALLTQ